MLPVEYLYTRACSLWNTYIQGHAPYGILVYKGMLPVEYFLSNNAFSVYVEFPEDYKIHRVEVNLATLSFGDITGFRTVLFATCHVAHWELLNKISFQEMYVMLVFLNKIIFQLLWM